MSTRTAVQLATRVMRKQNWVDALHSPAAADSSYIVGVYEAKLAEWADRDDLTIYWTADTTPLAIFEPLADLLINQVGETYEPKGRTPEQIQEAEEVLLRPIRRHIQKRGSGLPTPVDYF